MQPAARCPGTRLGFLARSKHGTARPSPCPGWPDIRHQAVPGPPPWLRLPLRPPTAITGAGLAPRLQAPAPTAATSTRRTSLAPPPPPPSAPSATVRPTSAQARRGRGRPGVRPTSTAPLHRLRDRRASILRIQLGPLLPPPPMATPCSPCPPWPVA